MKTKLNILIVDSSELARARIKELLMENESQINAGAVRSEAEALNMLSLIKIDAVILDVHLPVRMGMSLLRKIKTTSPSTKVIMFSNYEKPIFKNYCFKVGADFFFDKASEFPMLTKTVALIANYRSCEAA
ncbi:MAG: response regulator [Bacteroidota bacterium]